MKTSNVKKVEYTLSDLCIPNGIVRGPFGGSLKKEIFVKNGFKVYEQGNAIYRTVKRGNYYINKNKYNELIRFSVKDGDFIISCSGTIGCIYRIPKDAPQGIINQALLKLTIDDSKIDTNLFYLYFSWDNFQKEIIDDTQGGAMKNLVSIDKFKKTIFCIPKDLNEQQKIATALTHIDNLINDYEKLIKKKEAIKKGMMQELLQNEKFEKCKISQLFIYKNGKSYEKDVVNNGKYEIINLNSVSLKGELKSSNKHTNKSDELLKKDDLVMILSDVGHGDLLGRVAIIPDSNKYVLNQRVALLRPKEKFDVKYVYYYINYQQEYFKVRGAGSSQLNISKGTVENFVVQLPDLNIQKEISKKLYDIDNFIQLYRKKFEKFKSLKKSMMSNLLTGKIRL